MALNNQFITWFANSWFMNTWLNNSSFPWLSKEATKKIKDEAKKQTSNSYEQKLIEQDLYKKEIENKKHDEFVKSRQNTKMSINQMTYEAKDEKQKKNLTARNRTWEVADMLREVGRQAWKNWDTMSDAELISRYTTKNPSEKSEIEKYIAWDESSVDFAKRMWYWVTTKGETALQKAWDFAVWVLQSPWKRGYNMIWQWMDKLWKSMADKLQGSDLQKRVQKTAIDMFGEDEVRAFQQQKQKELEEGTAFKGRTQTDITKPILWEERANSWWAKAWEVVWDIATWIAVTAPIAWAVAPAIASSSVGGAAWIGALEWVADTLITKYWAEWELASWKDLLVWAGLGAAWWMFSRWLANRPQNVQQNIRKEAEWYIERSIKPTVKWKQNVADYNKFIDDTLDVTDYMSKNKDLLQYTDDAWNVIKWELPTNLKQTSETLWWLKKNIYDQYNAIAKQAGDAGARVKLDKVYQQLDDLERNVSQNIANPETKWIIEKFKEALIQNSDDLWTISIEDAQQLTQDYNKMLTAFFKNPNINDVSKNSIIASMNKWVKDAINESIDDVIDAGIKNWSSASRQYSALKSMYGKIKTIEDEVAKRALVDARKNIKGLDQTLLDSFAGGEITDAILTLNPSKAAKAGVIKWIQSYYKYLNNPNTNINKLFKLVDKANNPWTQSAISKAVNNAISNPSITNQVANAVDVIGANVEK